MPVVKPVERVKGSKGRKVAMLTEMGVKYWTQTRRLLLRGRVVPFELSGR